MGVRKARTLGSPGSGNEQIKSYYRRMTRAAWLTPAAASKGQITATLQPSRQACCAPVLP